MTTPPSAPASARPGTLPGPSPPAALRRTARPGHGPPATPDGCPPSTARSHLVRTPGAGCGPAPPPGQPPRTGRRSGAARSPATTPYDTACPPSQDHMTSLTPTNRFYYLRHAEHGNSSRPSRRASKSGDLLSAASSPDLRHVFSTANRCRPMLTSTSRTTQGPARHTLASPSNGRIRRVSRWFSRLGVRMGYHAQSLPPV